MILCFLSASLFITPYLLACHYSLGMTSAFITYLLSNLEGREREGCD